MDIRYVEEGFVGPMSPYNYAYVDNCWFFKCSQGIEGNNVSLWGVDFCEVTTPYYDSGVWDYGSTTCEADRNGNGLPDWWEQQFFSSLSQSTSADNDGDGLSSLDEYVAGSSPVENNGSANPIAWPPVGARYLRIISPSVLELVRITADTTTWDFAVGGNRPQNTQFDVKVNGTTVPNDVQSPVGFKRRPIYAPLAQNDLRIENCLYMKLNQAIADGALVEVVNTAGGPNWPENLRFIARKETLRYNPAIHINEEGYLSSSAYPKRGMVGYLVGDLEETAGYPGELNVGSLGFDVMDTHTGLSVYHGTLAARTDSGWDTYPIDTRQYQKVMVADFTSCTTAGEYVLRVDQLGASLPFRIDNGTAIKVARTYALGLYHQRCGAENVQPFTRFTHNVCHSAAANIPMPQSSYTFIWNTLATYAAEWNSDNPIQMAPALNSQANQRLAPFPTGGGTVPVSGGHHDAGDYSKYTMNSAMLIHSLIFAADHLPGVAALDNLGIPESGDGIGDILQLAKWEADFLKKMQAPAPDSGFYFLVYPRATSEYEADVLPDHNDPRYLPQVVYPVTSSATAAAAAALAEIGSSPTFMQFYPTEAAAYLAAAQSAWTFLDSKITQYTSGGNYGKDYLYQKITHYGDEFTHDDEFAWMAAALWAATGNTVYHSKLLKWYPRPDLPANNYSGQWVRQSGVSLPSTGNLRAFVKYVPNTAQPSDTSATITFRVFDSESARVVDRSQTEIITAGGVPAQTKINQLKIDLNSWAQAHPTVGDDPSWLLERLSGIVGNCHGTWRYGWQHAYSGYGCAIRNYAFAAHVVPGFTARRTSGELNATYLGYCQTEITRAGNDARTWSENNAYGTSLPYPAKAYYAIGWYFSGDWAFDIAAAEQIAHDAGNIPALIENFNFELGRNPLNASFVNGLGWKRQRETVNQYAQNDIRVLPPSGIPQGNVSDKFLEPGGNWPYGSLEAICFPGIPAGKDKRSFGFYERWADTYNIEQEFVSFQSARALATAAYLAAATGSTGDPWRSADPNPVIDFPNGNPTLTAPGVTRLTAKISTVPMDLSSSRVLWEVEGQEPRFGQTASVGRSTPGPLHVEAEAVLPDGRRVFASKNVLVNDPNGGSEFTPDGNTIALYHFNSISGNQFLDSSGRGHHLTISGGATLTDNTAWMQTSPPGANAVRFRNVGDKLIVTIPYGEVYPSSGTTLTIDFRIYPRAYKGDGQTLLGLYQEGQSDAQWQVFRTASWDPPAGVVKPPEIRAPSATIFPWQNWDIHVALNTWNRIRITLDSNGISRAFINDMVNPVGTSTVPPTLRAQNWVLSLGNFDGDIDELKINR